MRGAIYGKLTENQPANGVMKDQVDKSTSLPEYERAGVISIDHLFPSGVQTVSIDTCRTLDGRHLCHGQSSTLLAERHSSKFAV